MPRSEHILTLVSSVCLAVKLALIFDAKQFCALVVKCKLENLKALRVDANDFNAAIFAVYLGLEAIVSNEVQDDFEVHDGHAKIEDIVCYDIFGL